MAAVDSASVSSCRSEFAEKTEVEEMRERREAVGERGCPV